MSPGASARDLLESIVSEERRGRPGEAREAALSAAQTAGRNAPEHLIVAVYAALAAGEPRRALELLDRMPSALDPAMQRRIRAGRAWAQQLDRNWYPGDTGAEGVTVTRDLVFVGEVLPGDAETMLVEACAAYGPGSLLSKRWLLESFFRRSAREAAPVLQSAVDDLERFKQVALASGVPASACWAMQCQADLLHRCGAAAEAQQQLEQVRSIYAAAGDRIGIACSHMVEGDWWATPGSSPEALGLDLGGRTEPSPLADTRDLARATLAYDKAQAAAASGNAPRVVAALTLRRAVVSFLSERPDEQADWLRVSERAFAEAGEVSGCHLAFVHRLAGGVARGDFAQLRRDTPSEWGSERGPLAEIAAWAGSSGSLSFCTGLGRILEIIAGQWEAREEFDRAECAYLMARPLLSAGGVVPGWAILLALAKLDARRNVQVRTMVRRLRVLAGLPPPPTRDDSVRWLQDIQMTMPLIDIPTGSMGMGEIAIRAIERGSDRLAALLGTAGAADQTEGAAKLDPRAVADELRKAWTDLDPYQAARSGAADRESFTRLVIARASAVAREQLARARPHVSFLSAMQAERGGWDARADAWYQSAQEQLRSAGTGNQWLAVLVLCACGKHEEARALLERVRAERSIDGDLVPDLALRARDFATAWRLFREMDEKDPHAKLSWIDFLNRTEAALECGDANAALRFGLRARDAFEAAVNRLPRDPDRVAACDDIKAGALYLLLSRVYLALDDHALGFNMADRGHALALPRLGALRENAGLGARMRLWQQAATDQATAYQRVLAALARAGGEPGEDKAQSLSRAEEKLNKIEASFDAAERASLVSAQRQRDTVLAELQSLLPHDACLLEYQLVGRDLMTWAVTRSSIRGKYARLSGRPLDGAVRRLVYACAAGQPSVEAEELSRLLLDPFSDLLERAGRVIVVPFGPLHTAPFHVLPFRREPLGVTHVISYLPSASLLAATGVDGVVPGGRVVVVGDPAFDSGVHPSLRRLPGAALEARVVARLHRTDDVFLAERALESDVRAKLAGSAVLHFACHGRLDDVAPNTSSIVLAGSDELDVSDLIGLQVDAELAVLSACDTGRGTTTLGGDLVGLTRGLLAAGVKRSVVSLWPVDDVAACVTMTAFHEKLHGGESPAAALAKAQREIRAMAAEELAARYRELGGVLDAGAISTRRKASRRPAVTPARGLPAFPEADLDDISDMAMEESHGSLARNWAPFVLIGC
jgi:CHAT domain-containing protein